MDFLTTAQVARYFGVSARTVRGYIERGSVVRRGGGRVVVKLAAVMHPAGLRVREGDLAAFERELTGARLGREEETERGERRGDEGVGGVVGSGGGKRGRALTNAGCGGRVEHAGEVVMNVAFPDGERPRPFSKVVPRLVG